MGAPAVQVASFESQVQRLTVDDWKRVYDASPLGHGSGDQIPLIDPDHYSRRTDTPWEAKERLTKVLEETLGDGEAAETRGDGRVNFLSYCMDRLFNAVDAIGNSSTLSLDSFVAGYGPFLQVIPPSAVGLGGEIAELWDPIVRTPIVERYAEVLRRLHGRQTAADGHLADDAARISLALCLDSIGASPARRAELEEMYVSLCAFPSVASFARTEDADPVLACENARIEWLGYADVRLPERVTIGTGIIRTVAREQEITTAMMFFGGVIPLGAVIIAAFIATGGRLDLFGFLGAIVAGLSGAVIAMITYLKLSARTKFGSVERRLALGGSVLLLIVVSALCGYLYIRFITR